MRIAGLDVATNTGIALFLDGRWEVSSFKPKFKRPEDAKKGSLIYPQEGQVCHLLREHLRPLLIANRITHMGVEMPLNSNASFSETEVDMEAEFAGQAFTRSPKGGTTMATLYRLYGLNMMVFELGFRLGIECHVANQSAWRSKFIGVSRSPNGTADGGKWLKAKSTARCAELGITVKNSDQAEAVGVAYWLAQRIDPAFTGRLL